jgi:vacuolar-type H+-ATPase subunit E/Vma4
MEELLSTEALDNEILEDARKKAFKILKTADETLEGQSRDWEKKIQESLESIRDAYRRRIENSQNEILARLPLDKRRMRSEISESSLSNAMREFLSALKRETLLIILENEISKRLTDFNSDGAVVKFSGLSLSEAKKI